MALTFTINDQTVWGNKHVIMATIALDSSYPTGGEAVTAANFGLNTIERFLIQTVTDGTRLYSFDAANSKIQAWTALATEVTNTTDLSAVTNLRVMVIGY